MSARLSHPKDQPGSGVAVVAISAAYCDAKSLQKIWPISEDDRYYLYKCDVKESDGAKNVKLQVAAGDPNSAGIEFNAEWTSPEQISQPFSASIPAPAKGSTLVVAVYKAHCDLKGLNIRMREKRPVSLDETLRPTMWWKLGTTLEVNKVVATFGGGKSIDLLDKSKVLAQGVSFDADSNIQLVLNDAGIRALGVQAIEKEPYTP